VGYTYVFSWCEVASNVTGGWLSDELLASGTYWADHMRGTLRWRQNAVELVKKWDPQIVVEVAPQIDRKVAEISSVDI
jgi:acyl transferase domain-containing protein